MKKYGYYHIYLTDDTGAWSSMFLDQVFSVIDSGLMDAIDAIYINCIGNQEQIDIFKGLCSQFSKITILNCFQTQIKDSQLSSQYLDSNTVFDETITLKALQDHASRENAYFLYFHSKGITSVSRLKQSRNYKHFINYRCWRKFMEWGVIENWDRCINMLNVCSCVSVNFCAWPTPHYSGGMWWSKSEYIKTLPDISSDEWWVNMINSTDLKTWNSYRLKPEMWIGASFNDNFFSLLEAPDMPPISSLAETYYPRSNYA